MSRFEWQPRMRGDARHCYNKGEHLIKLAQQSIYIYIYTISSVLDNRVINFSPGVYIPPPMIPSFVNLPPEYDKYIFTFQGSMFAKLEKKIIVGEKKYLTTFQKVKNQQVDISNFLNFERPLVLPLKVNLVVLEPLEACIQPLHDDIDLHPLSFHNLSLDTFFDLHTSQAEGLLEPVKSGQIEK